jgi:omega-6 fatty acid desaturase (delta-12 desaturase)
MLRPFQAKIFATALWQAVSTFGLFFAATAAMYASSRFSIWLTLILAIPTSGLIVRIFVFQHDCGHNAMFPSVRDNLITGFMCSLVTVTPFAFWRRHHAQHHKAWNNLDVRGIPGGFLEDCITVAEYRAMSRRQKLLYRLIHHPILLHFFLPPAMFILGFRFPIDTPASARQARMSVYGLDLALVVVFGALIWVFGVKTVMLVHLPAMVMAAIIGIWMFSVQHRFEEAQWTSQEDWTVTRSAMHSTSYFKLPRVLQWFTGNIGLHHVHHLRPSIPNYRLQECHDACTPVTGIAKVLTIKEALRAPRFALWDEELSRMVPFPS